MGLRVLAIVALAAAAACDGAASPAPDATVAAPPTLQSFSAGQLAVAHCALVLRDARCELSPERRLTVWDPRGRTLRWTTGRGAVTVTEALPLDGGKRYALRLPGGAQHLDAVGPGGRYRLPLLPADPMRAPLAEAQALRDAGAPERAAALLQAAAPSLPMALRSRARALSARIALARGDVAGAADTLQATMTQAFATGRVSEGVLDATTLAYVTCRQLRDYERCRTVLDRAGAEGTPDAAGMAMLPYYAGQLAGELGELQRALEHYREAARRCARLGLRSHERLAREGEAQVRSLLGQHAAAIAVQADVVAGLDAGEPACSRADRHETLVWYGIAAGEVGAALDPATRERVDRASRDAEVALQRCGRTWQHRNHLINAGLWRLYRGEATAAQAAAEQLAALAASGDPELTTWEAVLRGRLAMHRGTPDTAVPALEAAVDSAQRTAMWNAELAARSDLAEALHAAGRNADALQALSGVEAQLDHLVSLAPLSEGRTVFLRRFDRAVARMLMLQLRLDRAAAALDTFARARGRALSAVAHSLRVQRLDPAHRVRWERQLSRYRALRAELIASEEAAWQLSAARRAEHEQRWERQRDAARRVLDAAFGSLTAARGPAGAARPAAPRRSQRKGSRPTPAPPSTADTGPPQGEVWLAFARAPDGGWLGLSRNAAGARGVRLSLPSAVTDDPEGLARGLLQPFAPELRAAQLLRLLVHGDLHAVDVHALPFEGAPLLHQAPVVYALGLSDRSSPARSTLETGAPALIVADPTGDLHSAAVEGRWLADQPFAMGATLVVGSAAQRRAVLVALGAAGGLFHYAGHARNAGAEGLQSELLLSDGPLTVPDVLSIGAGPRQVVLSACEAAAGDGAGIAAGLGLSEAFLAAGADVVVAPRTPVPDRVADAMMRAFYAALQQQLPFAQALQQAQLKLAASGAAMESALRFRLLTP